MKFIVINTKSWGRRLDEKYVERLSKFNPKYYSNTSKDKFYYIIDIDMNGLKIFIDEFPEEIVISRITSSDAKEELISNDGDIITCNYEIEIYDDWRE